MTNMSRKVADQLRSQVNISREIDRQLKDDKGVIFTPLEAAKFQLAANAVVENEDERKLYTAALLQLPPEHTFTVTGMKKEYLFGAVKSAAETLKIPNESTDWDSIAPGLTLKLFRAYDMALGRQASERGIVM